MSLSRSLKWIALGALALLVVAAIYFALSGWNWLRGPIERAVVHQTGRALAINGDLTLHLAWPLPRLRAQGVTFANPAWAREKQMIAADMVEVTLDLAQLLRQRVVLHELRLVRPVVFLEQASAGRKSWLLDLNQQDEDARLQIGRLTLDQGTLGFDDAALDTSIRAEISTTGAPTGGATAGIAFRARGTYKGLALKAKGTGGPVLALRDESTPYPLDVDVTVGHTGVKAQGTVTSLLTFSGVDMQLSLRGNSLEQLFPLLGVAVPATRAYATQGHLSHAGSTWRYDAFSGRIGNSDIAGSLRVETGGKRPSLTGELVSNLLDLEDLGPIIGAQPGRVQAAKNAAQAAPKSVVATPAPARILPDLPFKTERWDSIDAQVGLRAKAIRRAGELPLENLATHLSLRDAVLNLDPLRFGLAGGQLDGVVSLDGRKDPIQAHARVTVKKVQLARLFPGFELNRNSSGQVNGEFDLAGHGSSVGRMLASADGKLGLVVSGGTISKLMMEKAGLHLWEILELQLAGDRQVKLRCVVADFDVKNGVMRSDALVFDTEVTTITGKGSIDLAREQLDLTLNQDTKNTSPLALRSPITIRGSFARPEVGVDKGRVAARAIGALALGLVNPLLALLPLIDAGPGQDSDCGQLVRAARALPGKTKTAPAPGK